MRIFKLTLVLASVAVLFALQRGEVHDGLLEAVEVTATRCSENIGAYVGAVSGVEITARRYEFEDDAWSGLMPETVVTAVRSTAADIAYLSRTGLAR